ncbi:hypothetical protein ACFL1E_00790 [Candidatus Omnitrophota bacterium]
MNIWCVIWLMIFSFVFTSSVNAVAIDPRLMKQKKQQRIMQHKQQQRILQHSNQGQGAGAVQQQQISDYSSEEDVRRLIDDLKQSSSSWPEIANPEIKAYIVNYFVTQYRQQGIAIKKHPARYVVIIDDMASQNPGMLSNSFDKILQIVAIIEYDFDNGQDKDALAKRVLGEQGYLANKKRLGIQ